MAINSHLNYAKGVSDASHENVVQYYEPLRTQSNASHCCKMLFIAFCKRISITNDGFKCRRNTIFVQIYYPWQWNWDLFCLINAFSFINLSINNAKLFVNILHGFGILFAF